MKIKSVHKKLLPLLLGATLFVSGCGKEETPKTETPAEPAATNEVTPTTADSEEVVVDQNKDQTMIDSIEAVGYALCAQMQIGEGLSETEAEALANGFKKCLLGKEAPEGFQNKYMAGMMYLQQRMQEQQQKALAENQKIADSKKAENEAYFTELKKNPNVKVSDSGLYYEIIEPGDANTVAASGDQVEINYKGTLTDGREFDSSYTHNKPVTFPIDKVIPGFSEGCKLVGQGGKIKLYIPSELGYGVNAPEGSIIEPGDTLIFEVELLKVIPASETPAPEETATEQPVG